MKRFVSLGLVLMVMAAIPAAASTFLKMSQKDLIRDSQAVVQGKVLQVNSFWNKAGTIIVSEAMVQVEEKILGDAPTVVFVRTLGGTVDGFTVEAHGFPEFKANERVLLFLEPEQGGASRVAGYQQGQYRLIPNKAGVEMAIPAFVGGEGLVTRDGRAAAPAKALSLDDLKASIRSEATRLGRTIEQF
jgi:hypothetical protein